MVSNDGFTGIQLQNIDFAYGREFIFKKLNYSFPSGCLHLLTGPNGVGKSTLFALIQGVYLPNWGHVIFSDPHFLQRLVSWNPRQGFYGALSVLENLKHFYFIWKCPEDPRMALEQWKVAHLSHRRFEELSLGQKSRVVLAALLNVKPSTLLLDEPDTHLDTEGKLLLKQFLSEMIHTDICVIVVTHQIYDFDIPNKKHILRSLI